MGIHIFLGGSHSCVFPLIGQKNIGLKGVRGSEKKWSAKRGAQSSRYLYYIRTCRMCLCQLVCLRVVELEAGSLSALLVPGCPSTSTYDLLLFHVFIRSLALSMTRLCLGERGFKRCYCTCSVGSAADLSVPEARVFLDTT
jgi:hypothetical protein